MIRYKSTGEIHKDFHGLTCATLHYLVDNYGRDALETVLQETAQKVYKTMHEALLRGDCTELAEYWEYYLTREGGDFTVEKLADGLRLIVRDCPALRHLVKLEQQPDHILCDATRIFDEALAQGSPFRAELKETGTFSCEQLLTRADEVKK
ncbi:MAG: hypothetical protein J5858_00690 [Lentisphaeria bacterium]|nr:hypothetical protein [Lentisphaeria bacterium]